MGSLDCDLWLPQIYLSKRIGLGRLETAEGPWGSGSYVYDAYSNVRSKSIGSWQVNIEYNNNNQVSRVTDSNRPLDGGSYTSNYSYDNRGNVTSDSPSGNGLRTMSYDLANQPTFFAEHPVYSSISYDGNYKRVKESVSGETIFSVYDQSDALVARSSSEPQGDNTFYINLAGQSFVRITNGEIFYPLNNHLGTALMVMDENGDVEPDQV